MKQCIYTSAQVYLDIKDSPIRDSKKDQDDQIHDIRVEIRGSWRSREVTCQKQWDEYYSSNGKRQDLWVGVEL